MKTLMAPARASATHEEVAVAQGERSGVTMAVAIHSTRLGPALGGARLWHYDQSQDGVDDAMRLAEAMTYKAAAAGLDLGGGKGVICAPGAEPPAGELREAMLLDFGDLVESLGGRYITAEDVGTSTADMVVIAQRTEHVTGMPVARGGAGDPSPFTAAGVQAAMRAACAHEFGTAELAGRSVTVIGLGHVGERLARSLAAAGARVIVSDIDPRKRALAGEIGAGWVDPPEAPNSSCDVLAPCAIGGLIDEDTVDSVRAPVICGAANNQLANEGMAAELKRRGILFAPDFIANAGGLIAVYRELRGYDAPQAWRLVARIQDVMDAVLRQAAAESTTPLAAARALAARRLDAASR